MNLSKVFIERPVATALLCLAILLFGVIAFRGLPVAALPTVDYPTIQVNAALPGANPETMASSVATPLEREFSTIAGIDTMSSVNGQGSSAITVQFNLSRNIDAAAQDIQAKIASAGGRLPPSMPRPPTYQKVNPAEQPIFYLAVSSQTLPMYKVTDYASNLMAQRISMVPGVSRVQIFGEQKYAVRVQADPDAMAAHNIGIDEVQKAISSANTNLPTGRLNGPQQAFTIESNGSLGNAAAYRPLIVAYRNGAPVRLDQVATVLDGVENDRQIAWINDVRCMVLAINKQPGTNTVEVVDNINRLLPEFRREIPPAVQFATAYDASISIRNSIRDVEFTLVLTVGIVVMVIFLFLRNVSATLIPGAAVPFSIVGTFAVMYLLGYSLNNLSLMALTLSVGFVVDDAIVMLENIVRHMEMGKTRMEAAFAASREIGFTILSMTFSLVAVFIPVLFMQRHRRPAAARVFGDHRSGDSDFGLRFAESDPDAGEPLSARRTCAQARVRLQHARGRIQSADEDVRDHAAVGSETAPGDLPGSGGDAGGNGAPVPNHADRLHSEPGQRLHFRRNAGTAGDFVRFDGGARARGDEGDCRRDPEIAAVGVFVPDSNSGFVFAVTKPRKERKDSVDQILEQLRPRLFSVPGILTFLQNPPPITVSGQAGQTSVYQLALQSHEPGRDLRVDAEAGGGDEASAGLCGRAIGHADFEPAGDGRYRSRPGAVAGHHAAADSGRAVQRVQPARGVGDLCGRRINTR